MKKTGKAEDKRFKIAHREALIGVIIVLINFLIWYGFGYGFGSAEVEQYRYIFGLPEWFFYSCIVGPIIIIALVIVTVKYIFKDVTFDDEEGDVK